MTLRLNRVTYFTFLSLIQCIQFFENKELYLKIQLWLITKVMTFYHVSILDFKNNQTINASKELLGIETTHLILIELLNSFNVIQDVNKKLIKIFFLLKKKFNLIDC